MGKNSVRPSCPVISIKKDYESVKREQNMDWPDWKLTYFHPLFKTFRSSCRLPVCFSAFLFFLVHFHTSQLDAKVGKINPPENPPPKKDPVRHFEDVNGKNCLWSRLQVLGERF